MGTYQRQKQLWCRRKGKCVLCSRCAATVVGTPCVSDRGRGGVSVRAGSGQTRCEWLQRRTVQFGFGAFPLVWENKLAGVQWVSFISLAERLEARKMCRCTTMCELAAREQRCGDLKYLPLPCLCTCNAVQKLEWDLEVFDFDLTWLSLAALGNSVRKVIEHIPFMILYYFCDKLRIKWKISGPFSEVRVSPSVTSRLWSIPGWMVFL